MPFPPNYSRRWTREVILALKKKQIGVYGIFRGEVCIYVGKGDIRDRLLDHFNGDNPLITRERPDRWTAVLTDDPDRQEKKLILEYDPVANRRVG
jgi:hypothetical protein